VKLSESNLKYWKLNISLESIVRIWHQNLVAILELMLIVRIKEQAQYYTVFYNTIHTWEDMKDYGRKVLNPVGETTSKLNILISYILTEKSFIETISNILNDLEIYELDFIASSLSEALFLTEPEMRDNGLILIDCGYITTSVSLVKGDGILALKAFSMGGGHITGDLCQCLNLSFSQAENLKRKVVLSLDATDNDFYEVNIDGKMQPVSAKLVNEIILARLDMFSDVFNKILNSSEFNTQNKPFIPILITGGGLNYLKGAKDYLSKQMGKNLEYIAPSVPQMNKPHYSGILSILDIALIIAKIKKLSRA